MLISQPICQIALLAAGSPRGEGHEQCPRHRATAWCCRPGDKVGDRTQNNGLGWG